MAELTIQQAFDLALQYHRAGQLAPAQRLYRQILAQQPNHPEALHWLGILAAQTGHCDVAVGLIGRAAALRPDDAVLHNDLGNALGGPGRLDEAIAAYRRAIALKPDYAEAYGNLGNALMNRGQLDEAMACYRQALTLRPGYYPAHSNLLVCLHYHSGYDAAAIGAEHRRWNQVYAQPLTGQIRSHANDRSPQRRLRIGYVSPYFVDHSLARFFVPLLTAHDRGQFEIFCYAQLTASDHVTRLVQERCDGWRVITSLSDEQAAQLVRQDQIDILIDLSAHTANNRLLVFARKPAPVQVTYLAYCSTTGLDAMDYRLTDPQLDPPGGDESCYSEQSVRLPQTYWCYKPSMFAPPVNALPALAQGSITFGCLNDFCKVSEATLAVWAQVLRAVPASRLLVHARQGSHRQRVHERLAEEGIEPARVQFADFMPMKRYLELYHQIDIALDTFPWAGGTTTCDALWMGVPVVSLVGKTAVGRGGLSILSNVGLPELAARGGEEYVRVASDLAGDPGRLSDLRLTLRQRMEQSPLMDAPRFAGHVEAAYRQMWRNWCQKAGTSHRTERCP